MKNCWILLLGIILVSCHSQKGMVKPAADHPFTALTPGEPHLLLLTGTISYDSIITTYLLDFTSEKYVDGYININDADQDSTGLYCIQIGKGHKVLKKQAIENPLLQDVEFLGQAGYEHKVTFLPKADIFFRIQLENDVREIEFRYGEQTIKRLMINN